MFKAWEIWNSVTHWITSASATWRPAWAGSTRRWFRSSSRSASGSATRSTRARRHVPTCKRRPSPPLPPQSRPSCSQRSPSCSPSTAIEEPASCMIVICTNEEMYSWKEREKEREKVCGFFSLVIDFAAEGAQNYHLTRSEIFLIKNQAHVSIKMYARSTLYFLCVSISLHNES